MRINKMTSYAIRIVTRMMQMKRIVTSKELQELEGIPHGILMKILRALKDEKIVISYQGRGGLGGGYALSDKGRNITIYQLVKVMEGGVRTHPEMEKALYKADKKRLYEELEQLNQEYIVKLKEVRLADYV